MRVRFLSDTVAEVSFAPPKMDDSGQRQEFQQLQAVNESSIKAYEVESLALDIGVPRTFRWTLSIEDFRQAIIGAEFSTAFRACRRLAEEHASER